MPTPDGYVNVQELSLIQNIILTGEFPDGTPLKTSRRHVPIAKVGDDGDAKVTIYVNEKGIKLYLDSKIGIRGAQVEFANVDSDPKNMTISTDLGQGYYYYLDADKILRTLLYDPHGKKFISAGEHLMADLPFELVNPDEVTLDKLILVDVDREKLARIQVETIYGKAPTAPTNYDLSQNYPNPFNPSTTIEFSIPENVSNVKLSIYNILGEKVAELVNTALQAGNYSYKWDAGNFASGMYICELRTDKYVSVKKMLLLK
jgi:hypothetical protein